MSTKYLHKNLCSNLVDKNPKGEMTQAPLTADSLISTVWHIHLTECYFVVEMSNLMTHPSTWVRNNTVSPTDMKSSTAEAYLRWETWRLGGPMWGAVWSWRGTRGLSGGMQIRHSPVWRGVGELFHRQCHCHLPSELFINIIFEIWL